MAHISTLQVSHPTLDENVSRPDGPPSYLGEMPSAMQSRAMGLLATLHTNLDIKRLLQAFSREISEAIPHGAIGIDCPECHLPLPLDAGPLRQRIHLIVDQEYLCDLDIHGPKKLTVAEQRQLELWLRVLAYPLRNALQLHKMRTQVFRDALTGVQNRIAMDQAMAREVASAQRHHTELSLLVIDIDWFKSINDKFGHSTGDLALQVTAEQINASLRDSDQLFRYGGEEFTVLMSHTDTLGALKLAERIRRNLAGCDHMVGDIRIPITASIGVASLLPDDTVESLFEKADRALYRAKHGGRNKVCCHQLHKQGANQDIDEPLEALLSKAQ